MTNNVNLKNKELLYLKMYNEVQRSQIYGTKDIDNALRFYESCPDALKEFARMLAISEVFKQLKLVLSRTDKAGSLSKGEVSKSFSKTLVKSAKQVKALGSYLKILESDLDLIELIIGGE